VIPEAVPPAVTPGGGEGAGRLVGHRDVDAVLSAVRDVETMECAEQIEVYRDVHRSLQRILGTIDAA
jgi:hypothetical protein